MACVVRYVSVACAILICVFTWIGIGPAVADDPRSVLLHRANDLIERQEKCAANLRVALLRLSDATRKPYLSPEDRQKDWERLSQAVDAETACSARTDSELLKALAALEIQSQKDVDKTQMRLRQAEQAEKPALEKSRDEAAKSVNWSRFQRLQRERLDMLKAMEKGCELKAKETTEFIQSDVARRSYTREGGTRTYRDQARDLEMFEQERQRHLACANNSRLQQAEIRLALRGGAAAGGSDRATFERETQALLRELQEIAAQLDDRRTLRYEDFTARIGRLSPSVKSFKARHISFLADKQGQPMVGKLIEAADLVVQSADTWRRAGGVQDAQRDLVLREVALQWQTFQRLIRETAELAARDPGR